jgi:hypothetical protein
MRSIASDFFSQSPLMLGPQIAMFVFLAIFLSVILRVFLNRTSEYEAAARMPLDDSFPVERASQSKALVVSQESGHE